MGDGGAIMYASGGWKRTCGMRSALARAPELPRIYSTTAWLCILVDEFQYTAIIYHELLEILST